MTAKHKVVDTDNLRAKGAVIPPSIKTTVIVRDKYFNGTKMIHLDGCGDVAALDGLAGVYWNLKAVDILIMDINGEAIRLPSAGLLLPSAGLLYEMIASPAGYNNNIEPNAEYNEHGVLVSRCMVVSDFGVPEMVPVIVSDGLLQRLHGRDNVYITERRPRSFVSAKYPQEQGCQQTGLFVYHRLLKVS